MAHLVPAADIEHLTAPGVGVELGLILRRAVVTDPSGEITPAVAGAELSNAEGRREPAPPPRG